METEVLIPASRLTEQLFGQPPDSLEALAGGRNNQVFRLTLDQTPYLLKRYFRHPLDSRDRLATEFGFLDFAWNCGVTAVPRPLGQDKEAGIGLYEFISGAKIDTKSVSRDLVDQALDFIAAINRHGHRPEARRLPRASEACLDLDDHLHSAENRLKRLQNIEVSDHIDQEARSFVDYHLIPAWTRIRAGIETGPVPPPQPETLISPSDFGFHNALREEDGRVRFLDFEYAGWDDPVKLAADFVLQPEMDLSADLQVSFVQCLFSLFKQPELIFRRFLALAPVHHLKWCGILLNDFLPVSGLRRDFALNRGERGQRRASQLEKAKSYFKDRLEPLMNFPRNIPFDL